MWACPALADADPGYGYPPPVPPCNGNFYVAGPCGCWYGPNYCYRGPCLPPAPFGGVLPYNERYASKPPGYAPPAPLYPGQPAAPPLAGIQVPLVGPPRVPPPPGTPVFPTHPFAARPA